MSSESTTDQVSRVPGVSVPGPAEAAQGRAPRRPLVRAAGYVLALALLALLAHLAVGNWRAVSAYPWHVQPALLAASCVCLMAGRCILPWGVRWVLRLFGEEVPLRSCWRAYALSQFAKYVPGGVWLFLARTYLYRRCGVAYAAGGIAVVLEQVLVVAGSLVVFLGALPWFPWPGHSRWLWACVAAAVLVAALVHPRVVSWAYNLVSRRTGAETERVQVGYRGILSLLGVYVGFWAATGLAFCLLAAALTSLPASLWPAAGGMFAGACGLGFLVVVAPAGLGVREGSLAGLLSLVYPLPVAVALALASRLWWFVIDVAFSAASLGILALVEAGRPAAKHAWEEKPAGGRA